MTVLEKKHQSVAMVVAAVVLCLLISNTCPIGISMVFSLLTKENQMYYIVYPANRRKYLEMLDNVP